MSDLDKIVSCYNEMKAIDAADEAEKIKAKFALEKLLLSTNDLSVIDFVDFVRKPPYRYEGNR